jgi:type I restriction enzyme S subunit
MSFPRYPEYKDSGVEWLGQVPAHWKVQSFKHQVERNDGGVWGEDPDGINDTIVLRSTEQTVDGHWKLDDPAPRKLSESEFNSSLLAENDLLLTKSSGSSLHIGKTTLVTAEIASMRCCYSNFMQRIRMKPTFLPKLAWYVMNNDLARLQFDLLSNSSTGLANLNATMVGQIVVPVPPVLEQTKIAAFLDHETAKIDALVAEQRRLMELLKEKRQAVISHAVTKGLNPDALMKPSGIEWLGDVPQHWEVKRLKNISPFITVGVVVNPSTFVSDEGHPFIYGGDIREGVIDWMNSRRITSEASEVNSKTRLQKGDLLTVRVGAPGITAVVPVECEGGNCASVMLVRKGDFNSHWLCFAMNTRIVRFQVEVVQYGAAQEQFNISHAINFWIPTPPRSEQDEIAEFLVTESLRFDTLSEEAQRAIDLLQERRTALISATVTGQIDVRSCKND